MRTREELEKAFVDSFDGDDLATIKKRIRGLAEILLDIRDLLDHKEIKN